MTGSNAAIGGGGFHHVAMKATDFDAAVAFYKALGFTEKIAWGDGDKRAILLDTGDGNYLEIFAGGSTETKPEGAVVHFALRTRNCDGAIAAAFSAVPWSGLEDEAAAFAARYPERLDLDCGPLELKPATLRAAAARFGAAVVQVAAMYRHLAGALAPGSFEFEVAVDEIEYRTTPVDHVYLATELHRLGVRWVSFAPRFVGEFEKGIDYLGDRDRLEADVEVHAAIARRLGGYKLSVHSGSDKFSIYEAVARGTRDRVHLKTSGTSYLVALETIAAADPDLMRRVWRVALEAYTTARATYHVSATAAGAPSSDGASAEALGRLLVDPNTREILHVTYGAVLHGASAGGGTDLGDDLRAAIWTQREAYWSNLAAHIGRHLRPFATVAGRPTTKGATR